MSTSTRVRNHVRSNVVGYLALFLTVTGGTAMAANTVFSSDIVNGEVKSVDIGTGEVQPADIQDGGVRTLDILDATVDGVDLANGAVTNAKLGSSAVNGAKVQNNSLLTGDVRNNTLTTDDISDDSLQQVDLANDVIASNEVVNNSLTGDDISSAFGRDSAVFVNIPDDGSLVELTQTSITPHASGGVLARAQGYCNLDSSGVAPGAQYQVQTAIGPDAGSIDTFSFWNHGLISTTGGTDAVRQANWIAERVFPASAGVPLTLSVFGYDGFGTVSFPTGANSNCSAVLTLQEVPDTIVEPAVASSSSGDMTGASK